MPGMTLFAQTDAGTITAVIASVVGLLAGIGALYKVISDGKRTVRTEAIDQYIRLTDRLQKNVTDTQTELRECRQNCADEQRRGDRLESNLQRMRSALRAANIDPGKWETDEGEAK